MNQMERTSFERLRDLLQSAEAVDALIISIILSTDLKRKNGLWMEASVSLRTEKPRE